jgi:hypothetical protein
MDRFMNFSNLHGKYRKEQTRDKKEPGKESRVRYNNEEINKKSQI